MIISGEDGGDLAGKIGFGEQLAEDRVKAGTIFRPAKSKNKPVKRSLRENFFAKRIVDQQTGIKRQPLVFFQPPEQVTVDQPDFFQFTTHNEELILFFPGPSPGI
jgi:hypothetical protein